MLNAIVTGGTQGIGKAIAEKLSRNGYCVYVADLSINEFKESEHLHFIPCNISSSADVSALFKSLENVSLDLLVNNAGVIRDNMIWNMPDEDFDFVMNVNLKGTWMMCKAAATKMKAAGKGKIVNITSRAWLGNRGQSNYSASKGGVVSLTRVLALELGKYGICVNAVAPGLIDTPLTQSLTPEVRQSLIEAQPTKSMGTPNDIANAVVFLGSPENNFITGQVLYVDGGKSIGAGV